ncbi:NACHT domain-containing protein [Pseudoalteromonas luteoviolacea]|uniref:NACHT domain-containing protein n=1 Tax=Pseudoalteromonas luteoviolacea TaxID=43657 RepID=UPI001B38E1F6|nr:NACHT domain-containing protein [Pseudoalteromonas luteoviolacea]MBQ4836588.1 NACHT domain-containing protein [Pseudoalteromonas luteoviolacea]
MLEVALSELIKAGISVAKDILGTRVKEKNSELLEAKRKKENDQKKRKDKKSLGLTIKELEAIALLPNEQFNAEILMEEDEVSQSLKKHLSLVKEWSGFIGFKDLQGEKKLSDIYVELDTYLMPLRTHFDRSERYTVKPLQEALFSDDKHAVVLGQPGAGKTTSMKKLCSNFFSGFVNSQYSFPVLIRFRDLNTKGSHEIIKSHLCDLLKLDIYASEPSESQISESWKEESIYAVINELKPILILDGFDELPTQSQKDSTLKEIRKLAQNCRESKIIITCRTGEFNYTLDHTTDFEISSLNQDQILCFARNWIKEENKAIKFVQDINSSPFSDTAIKPLSLAHLCAIYERTGNIPDRPKTVYRKVVNLMLEEWDGQRSINRESRYAKFEPDRKFEFLNHLSYYLTIHGNTGVFNQQQLIDAYSSICGNFGLPKEQSVLAANEIESHTGLFLQTGYLQYEFAHKSLQEYLTAEYLVKLPSLERVKKYIELLGSELAIATSISSNPSLYFTDIILGVFYRGVLSNSFYNAFTSRLSQERPDFYPSEDLVLASYTLLSQRIDDREYFSLMEKMLENCNVEIMTSYYELEAEGSDGTIVMKRIKQHDEYRLKTKLRIPSGDFAEKITCIA